jgi:hypothetical protein
MPGLSVARSFPRLLVLCSPQHDLHAALQSSARAAYPAPRNRKLDRDFRFPSETASVTGPPWRGQSSRPRSSLPRPRLARPGPPHSPSPERFRLGVDLRTGPVALPASTVPKRFQSNRHSPPGFSPLGIKVPGQPSVPEAYPTVTTVFPSLPASFLLVCYPLTDHRSRICIVPLGSLIP